MRARSVNLLGGDAVARVSLNSVERSNLPRLNISLASANWPAKPVGRSAVGVQARISSRLRRTGTATGETPVLRTARRYFEAIAIPPAVAPLATGGAAKRSRPASRRGGYAFFSSVRTWGLIGA